MLQLSVIKLSFDELSLNVHEVQEQIDAAVASGRINEGLHINLSACVKDAFNRTKNCQDLVDYCNELWQREVDEWMVMLKAQILKLQKETDECKKKLTKQLTQRTKTFEQIQKMSKAHKQTLHRKECTHNRYVMATEKKIEALKTKISELQLRLAK